MTRVLLLRHAETASPQLIHGAESDVALGARGFQQAEEVARTLAAEHPTAVYCSAMRRARQTAEPIARECGLEIQIRPELHERIMGPLSQSSWETARPAWDEAKASWMAGDLHATHEGGESYAQIRDRVVPVFRQILEVQNGRTVVVVAHGVVIKVLLSNLVHGRTVADFDLIRIENVAIHDLIFEDGEEFAKLPEA